MIVRHPGAVKSRSKLVRANGFVFFNVVPSKKGQSTAEQMEEVLALVDSRLSECGLEKSSLISITVYISEIARKGDMNDIWERWVDLENAPIRACIGSELDGEDLVELSVVAAE